jgi:hypothetical protein
MRVLSSSPRCLRAASALSRRADRCRRSHAHVCSAANDKNDVWSFFEGVKKARPLVASGSRRSQLLLLALTLGSRRGSTRKLSMR